MRSNEDSLDSRYRKLLRLHKKIRNAEHEVDLNNQLFSKHGVLHHVAYKAWSDSKKQTKTSKRRNE